jgi:integrase/recombinase XerD
MVRILAVADKRTEECSANGKDNARRIPGLILQLRYSGMRIGDTVSLTLDRISGNHLFLYAAKTGTPVYTVLPDFVVQATDTFPRMTEQRYSWSRAGKLATAVRVWETRLRKLFDLAKTPNGHANRFRDTFTIQLLLACVPIERVSVLLGHSSIRVTVRHYSPWVRSRQEQLEADIASAWRRDPKVLLEAKGTLEVQEKRRAVN